MALVAVSMFICLPNWVSIKFMFSWAVGPLMAGEVWWGVLSAVKMKIFLLDSILDRLCCLCLLAWPFCLSRGVLPRGLFLPFVMLFTCFLTFVLLSFCQKSFEKFLHPEGPENPPSLPWWVVWVLQLSYVYIFLPQWEGGLVYLFLLRVYRG